MGRVAKTVFAIAFILAAGLTMCGNVKEANAGEKKTDIKKAKIGVTVGHLAGERWMREIEMFKQYAAEHGFEILVQSAEGNVDTQIKQSENLINQNIDVLILQPVDSAAVQPIIEMAHEEGVPVIGYDILSINCDLDYYITFDSEKVGYVQAKFVTDNTPKGNYIWLKGSPFDSNAQLYARGQEKVLRPYIERGDINIVLEQWCSGWDPNEALRHCENGLSIANNNVQAVIASNDGTAGGAVQALEAQGLAGLVSISGQDADLPACQRIVEGIQTVTVYKPIARLNQACSELAVALALGKDPFTAVNPELGSWQQLDNNFKMVDSFMVDVIPITKENMYEVIVKRDKFQKLEDVYRNVPKDQWPKD